MTFTEIVADICDRLNLDTASSVLRIGKAVNRKYKQVTSSVGLVVGRRIEVTQAMTLGVPYLTFSGIEKVIAVIDKSDGYNRILDEVSYEELNGVAPTTDSPNRYAIMRMGAKTVTVLTDAAPDAAVTLYAEGLETKETLSGTDVPTFSESFHDILVEAVLVDEYRKLEKFEYMKASKELADERSNELRLFIAKSSMQGVWAGKTKGGSSFSASGSGGTGSGAVTPLWASVAFAAGDYTSNSGTWVLAAGDRSSYRYAVSGKVLFVKVKIDTATITGAPMQLIIKAPTGVTLSNLLDYAPAAYANDAGTPVSAFVGVYDSTHLYVGLTAGSAWTAGSNNNYVYFQGFFEVL